MDGYTRMSAAVLMPAALLLSAALLLPAGSLTDRLGARRTFGVAPTGK
jgi:nitrate/nitrite transporter NarK